MQKMFKSAALSVVLGLTGIMFAADWPNYRGPNADGTLPAANVADKLTLTPVWKVPSGDSFGQIAVEGDRVVTFIKRGDDEFAVCLDAKSGQERWTTRIDKSILDKNGGDGPRTTPTINDGRVFIFSTHLKLTCLDLASGQETWTKDIAANFGGKELQWGNAVSPVIVDDLVIVPGGGAGNGIIAFKKTTGELVWAKTDEKATHATPTLATILGTRQLICFMQSGLVSVDPQNGDVLWTFAHPYKTSTAASPVVGGKNGDIVYCSAGYQIGAAACRISKDGDQWIATRLWRSEGKNLSHWTTPVYHDGCIYGLFGHNDANGPLACLDIETGDVKWSKDGIGSQGALVLLGDKLLVETPKGDLILVAASPDAYKELSRGSVLKGKNWTCPTFIDGLLFVRNASLKRGEPAAEIACVKFNAD